MTHGSLFSGIGGFDLGAQMSGINTIWNCEVDAHKRQVLARHFPDAKQYDDITTMRGAAYVDIISGGFPCQDISISNTSKYGKKGIKGERSGLWREYARILGEVKPKYIIFENSSMLTVRGLEQVLCDLSKSGYNCQWQCLPASQFGFPHKRERIYGIAYPKQERCANYNEIFRPIPEILPSKTSRQNGVSMPSKRFNANSDYSRIRMYDGFSNELDKRRIEDCGNAVIPLIAHYIFECIKSYEKKENL